MNAPEGLGPRGEGMWRESTTVWQLTPAHLVLLEEACRIADRLDSLDAVIRGGGAEVGDMQGLLAEARQQSTALKSILAELRQGQKSAGASEAPVREGSGVADLSARIAARRGQAKG